MLYIDSTTGKDIGSGYEGRRAIHRVCGGPVPIDTFLDTRYSPISAIWAVSLEDYDLFFDLPTLMERRDWTAAVIHNPLAAVALPADLLPSFEEWVCYIDSDGRTIERSISRLPDPTR